MQQPDRSADSTAPHPIVPRPKAPPLPEANVPNPHYVQRVAAHIDTASRHMPDGMPTLPPGGRLGARIIQARKFWNRAVARDRLAPQGSTQVPNGGGEVTLSGSALPTQVQLRRKSRRDALLIGGSAAIIFFSCAALLIPLLFPRGVLPGFHFTPGQAIVTTAPGTMTPSGTTVTHNGDSATPTAPSAQTTSGPVATKIPGATYAPTSTSLPMPTTTSLVPSPTAPAKTSTATATVVPTVTPTPLPTSTPLPPTSTPNPFASTATVSFTRTEQPLSVGSNFTICAGCSINTGGVTVPMTVATSSVNGHGNADQANGVTTPATHADPVLNIQCDALLDAQPPGPIIPLIAAFGPCIAGQGTLVSANGYSCTTDYTIQFDYPFTSSVRCTLTVAGSLCYNFAGASFANNFGNQSSIVVTSGSGCGGSNAIVTYYMPSNCASWDNNGATARQAAYNAAVSAANTGAPNTLAGPDATFPDGNPYCGDTRSVYVCPGCELAAYSGNLWYQWDVADGWKLTWNSGDAQTLQSERLQASVPSGYTLLASNIGAPTANTSGLNSGSRSTTGSCTATGTAGWAWDSGEQSNLLLALAGQTYAHALSILQSWQGVNGGTAAIQLIGGTGNLPQNVNQITLTINS